MAGTVGAIEQRDNLPGHVSLYIALYAQTGFGCSSTDARLIGRGQSHSALIGNNDLGNLHAGDGGGHQTLYPGDLLPAECRAWFHDQGDGGTRLLAVPFKHRGLGDYQVHAGVLHIVQGADGASQLALERSLVGDAL